MVLMRWAYGKRFVAVVLAACLALACAGCAAPSPAPSASSSSAAQTEGTATSAATSAFGEDASGSSAAASAGDASGSSAAASAFPPFEEDETFADLKTQVSGLIEASGMDVGVAFVDLTDASRTAGFSVHGDMPLVSASMIKLAVLAAFLDEVDAGTLSLEEPYTIQAEDIVGGTGSVQSAGAGARYTLGELASLMIRESDNTAANILINRLGMDAVNEQAAELGLENTQLNRLMMDEEAQARHLENKMSAKDTARLLAMVWNGRLVSAQASAFALEALEGQTDSAGIAQGLPDGVVFAHKTGAVDLARNDGGIVEAEKPYVLVVFCSGGDPSASLELMGDIARVVHGQFVLE